MEARELRQENWVIFDGKPDQVEYIAKLSIGGKKYSHWDMDRVTPIELTPEILEKAGFIMKDEGYLLTLDTVVEINQICIEYDWSVSIGDVNANGFFASNIGICKYVHQLQNIIFALTGEELIIKL